MLEGFDGYVCDCWWFCLHCSSIMSTTILSKVIYTYTHISYMSISIYYCIYVYLYICNMTWLNNLYICVYINLSSNCWFQNFCLAIDTAAASSHSPEPSPGLGLQGLAIDGEGKGVWTRPHNRCRTEQKRKKTSGSWWFSDENFAETTRSNGPTLIFSGYWWNPDLLGGSKPHHLEGELLLVVGDLNWEVHLSSADQADSKHEILRLDTYI